MAVRFSDEQVLNATGGRRLRQGARAAYEAVCTDTRALTQGALFVALKGERFDAHDFLAEAAQKGAAAVVVEKGRKVEGLPESVGLFEVDSTLAALGALARFHRFRFKIPVGAITGSNGKTTTKEMVGAILATRGNALKTEGNLNNEVGVPLTLFRLAPDHVAAVVEMGMNAPGEIGRLTQIASPDAGLITVVQPAHLKGLGSVEGVAQAKGELYRNLGPSATAVVNVDDPLVTAVARGVKRTLTFGRSRGADVRLSREEAKGRQGLSLTLSHAGREHAVALQFLGAHNALNAAGAFALALALGYRPEECVQGLEQARPYARRLNVVDAPGGVVVLDDCYNANPSSMDAGLKTLASLAEGGRAIAVLGDMLELGADEAKAHAELGEAAAKRCALIAFFGPRSKEGYRAASAAGAQAEHFLEVEPLLAWLSPKLKPKDVVLVKASRGMQLERVVGALTGTASRGGH